MIKIKLDNKEISAVEGSSIMGAARLNGWEIPSMCYREGKEHFTSCMVCMVKDRKTGKLLPSCSTKVTEGMDIIAIDEEIREARKTGLELLLSEHVGDCEAPCQITCPAHMDIPLMNRLLAEGKFNEALQVVKKDIALPATLGRICPAPCEGACRRKSVDEAVSICLLKRYAGDADMDKPWKPEPAAANGKKVAIIGAGPAGLSAAYYLALKGYTCVVYDRRDKPGGTLWTEVEAGVLPAEVLQKETELIAALGVRFSMDEIDPQKFEKIRKDADAIVIAVGSGAEKVSEWGLEMTDKGILADKNTYQLGEMGVFVVGSALRHSKMAIRALGQGKEAAFSVDQFLSGNEVKGEHFMFNSRFGKLLPDEAAEYLKESVLSERIEPGDIQMGFNKEQVMKEAARCMHCDCRDIMNCKLRLYADNYKANQKRFWSVDRKHIEKQIQKELVIYEPSKCIKCGICVHMTAEYQEAYGMTFIGRGFDVVVGVPFNESIGAGLKQIAHEVAEACPTGAITKL